MCPVVLDPPHRIAVGLTLGVEVDSVEAGAGPFPPAGAVLGPHVPPFRIYMLNVTSGRLLERGLTQGKLLS